MAAIAAGPVFRLLGARDLGRSDQYQTEKMPAVNVEMLNGELAWRQHDGGHTDEPNVEYFIKWADKHLANSDGTAATDSVSEKPQHLAIKRADAKSIVAHERLLAKAKQGRIDVYFEGDSITRRWGATDYPKFLAQWNRHFHGWNAANFGWGGDTTQNILWRLQNGELDGVSPKVIVLQAGTNNLPWTGPAEEAKVDEIVTGIKTIIGVIQQQVPGAAIVLTGVFPRSQNMSLKATIERINARLSKLADGKRVRFLNINERLADAEGKLLAGISSDGLHLEEKGYEVWADALKPILTEIMGPPAREDHAPPPSGDPNAVQAPAKDVVSRPAAPRAIEVPDAVRIMRPTAKEVVIAEKALADFKESADPQIKALLKRFPSLVEVRAPRPNSAIVPGLAPFFRQKHQANLAVAKEGKADLLFLGDSITDFWRNERGAFAGKKVLEKYFGRWNVANFGIAGDTTQGVLYRLQNGEGEGFSPRAVMLMIGTNNTGRNSAEEIAEGIGAVVSLLRKCFPESRILLLGVFPRGTAKDPVRQTIREINDRISKLGDGEKVHYLDIGSHFLNPEGNIPADVMSDGLHPSSKGYEIWAEAVVPTLNKLMDGEAAGKKNR